MEIRDGRKKNAYGAIVPCAANNRDAEIHGLMGSFLHILPIISCRYHTINGLDGLRIVVFYRFWGVFAVVAQEKHRQ